MTVRDEKGRILTSYNAVITGMWKKAGYKEVSKAELAKMKSGKVEEKAKATEE